MQMPTISCRPSLLLVLLLLTLAGCEQVNEFEIERVRFNERLRLDGQPLDTVQQAATDLGFGPYQVTDAQLISPLYPVASTTGLDGRTSNLIQSDCLWLGRNGSTGAGDRVELSWEEVWTFAQTEDQAVASEEARSVGLCTYSNPVWRDALQLSFDELEEGQQTLYASRSDRALRISDDGAQLPGDSLVFACQAERRADGGQGIHCDAPGARIYGARLLRYQNGVADAVANPDGQCQTTPSRGGSVEAVSHLTDAVAPQSVEGYLPLCLTRAAWQPQRDSSLQLTTELVQSHAIDFGPNLMVVDQQRSLRRQMRREVNGSGAAATERWEWSTPVRFDAKGQARWQENFSASLLIEQATVILRRRGAPLLRPVTQELCLLGDDDQCQYRCRAQPQADGAVFTLERTYCRNASGVATTPELTPTYDHRFLDPEPGHSQTTPLRWVLDRAPALGDGDEVVLQFNLRARTRNGAALLADHSAFDFGPVQRDGMSARMETVLRNIGDQPVQLNDVRVVGANAEDFSVQLPDFEQAVPLPIDFLPAFDPSVRGIVLAWDFFRQPLVQHSDRKSPYHGLFEPRINEASFELYGYPFDIQHGMLLDSGLEADYVQLATQARHREHPHLADEARRSLGRPWMVTAERLRALPSILAVGESARVSMTALPRGLGHRDAMLQVRASTMSGAALSLIQLPLRAQALSGALLDAVPSTLSFPRTQAGQANFQRGLLLINVGETEGELQSMEVVGTDAAIFSLQSALALPSNMQPGQVEVITVLARPPRCSPESPSYRAALRFKLRGGEYQFVDLQSACAP